jgi:hypothetical protein
MIMLQILMCSASRHYFHSCEIPTKSRFFFLLSTSSRPALGVHADSYPMGTAGSFPRGKAAEALS